jgi:hypothetical protein
MNLSAGQAVLGALVITVLLVGLHLAVMQPSLFSACY